MTIMYPMFCQFMRMTRPQKPYLASESSVCSKFARTPLRTTCQIQPRTIPPMRLGMKKIVLNVFVPGTFFVSISARAKARMLMVITVMTVKPSVNQKACVK